MWNSIFNPDNWLFKPFGKLVDIVILSFSWALCSVVLLPFGGATTALYDAVAHCLRGGEQGPYARFFRSLKSNLLTGGVVGLILLALAFGLSCLHGLLYALADTGDRTWGLIYIAFWVFLILINGMLAYLFPVLSRFEFRVGGLFSTCLRLSIKHLPSTLLLGLITTASIIIVWIMIWPVLFIPCLWALAASLPLERIFRPFMQDQDEEE